MLVRSVFSAEEKPGKVKEKGRFSASGVGPAVPLWCGPRRWGGRARRGSGPGGTCWGRFQVESMGRAEDVAVSVCGVQESPWQGRGVLEMERTEKLCFCSRFSSPQPSISRFCSTCLSTPFISPCHFSSWSLKNNNKIVCNFVIFNLNLHFRLLLHPSE